jgi:hypothetical protein
MKGRHRLLSELHAGYGCGTRPVRRRPEPFKIAATNRSSQSPGMPRHLRIKQRISRTGRSRG